MFGRKRNEYKIQNQRTNGPVNAHLISWYKTKFRQIRHWCKIGPGQPRVTIFMNCVELEFIILHAKFHDYRT